jgi:hypothetical protein
LTSSLIDSLLKGIGCNMAEKAPNNMFPEECLVKLTPLLLNDLKALKLCIGALSEHSNLIHPEMLFKFINDKEHDLNVLGALLTKLQDRRFSKIINHCKKAHYKSAKPSKVLQLSAKIGQANFDPVFKSFSIKISEVDAIDTKKIATVEKLTKGNIYFKNRLLFGCNWRADIISCIQNGLTNPSEIKKRLNCSYETAHRVFSDYTQFTKIAG